MHGYPTGVGGCAHHCAHQSLLPGPLEQSGCDNEWSAIHVWDTNANAEVVILKLFYCNYTRYDDGVTMGRGYIFNSTLFDVNTPTATDYVALTHSS